MGAGKAGNFGNTKGSQSSSLKAGAATAAGVTAANNNGNALDIISDALAVASLIPGLDTFTDLALLPIDLARGDLLSAGLDAFGIIPFVGEVADTAKLAKVADKTLGSAKVSGKVTDIGKLSKKTNKIAKRSPIKIPKKAAAQVQSKNGYSQIKYTWEARNYKYTSRWHTRTPNAPKNQGASWVVERKMPGIGYGKNYRKPKEEILVGKNKWIPKNDWREAIKARKNGTATKKQKEWLDNGHWKD